MTPNFWGGRGLGPNRTGRMEGGYAESWSVYYALETEVCHPYGRYHQQAGAAWQERYITTVVYDEERGEYIQKEFLWTLQTNKEQAENFVGTVIVHRINRNSKFAILHRKQ